ncbi:hypothetical protein L3X14_16800 [Pseudomonas balearica]|uniref:hypothetical protein n=1 Tax=Stutzerimonas balearica TaxID=74829 RepID=UPI001F3ED616|nr:hypothetical protein [Stutzerimonas balearica]MCF6758238.1 hypothetical protein [Stutzerimonas balearica]
MMKIENAVLIVGSARIELPQLATDTVVHAWRVPAEYRENGLFVAIDQPGQPGEIPACDPQQIEYLGALDYPAAEDEALKAAKRRKLAEINALCDAELDAFSRTYPVGEMQSWPQQVKEAEALAVDPAAPAPLLAAIAAERGITVADLTSRVRIKMDAYAQLSGTLIGRRQAAEDQIDAAASLEDLEAVAW